MLSWKKGNLQTPTPRVLEGDMFIDTTTYKRIEEYGISLRKMERLCKKYGWTVERRRNFLVCTRYDEKLLKKYLENSKQVASMHYMELDDCENESFSYFDPTGSEEEIINTL